MKEQMEAHKVVSREEWLAAQRAHLAGKRRSRAHATHS